MQRDCSPDAFPASSLRELPAELSHADALRGWTGQQDPRATLDALYDRENCAQAVRMARGKWPEGSVTRDNTERAFDQAHATACERLSLAVADGLELRVGKFLRDWDGRVYLWLRVLGGDDPPGLSVCEGDGCGLVFRSRYAVAARCDRCHSKPRTPAFHVERDGDALVCFSPAGTIRQHRCAQCRRYFNPTRPDARHCSPKCRKAAHRGVPAAGGPDPVVVREYAGLLVAAMARPFAVYQWPADDPSFDLDLEDDVEPDE